MIEPRYSYVFPVRKSVYINRCKPMCVIVMCLAFLFTLSCTAQNAKVFDKSASPSVTFLTHADNFDLSRRMVVGRSHATITIDGRLDDDVWVSSAQGTFRSNRSLEEWKRIAWTIIPTPQLGGMGYIYAAWDDNSLYLGFRCEKQVGHRNIPPAPKAIGRNNRDIFADDSVRIYLQPKSEGPIYQIVANANGSLWDAVHTSAGKFDPNWNGEGIETAGINASGYYKLEVAIPFESLGLDAPNIGDIWRVNFCRTEKPSNEETSWSVTDTFNDAESFGILEFAKRPSRHSIRGRVVVEDTSKVLAGAFLQTPEGLYRTDADGRFSFSVASPGPVLIQVGAFEYRDVTLRVDVKSEDTVLPDIELSSRVSLGLTQRHVSDDTKRDMVVMAEDIYKNNPGFEYAPIHRAYQSCPKGVAVLDDGKILVTYTAFGLRETRGNMVVIDSSSDGGHTWESEVVITDGWRVAWGNFFHDPKGRLWLFTNPPVRVHRCDDPAQSPMQWSSRGLLDKNLDPRALGENSPITLSDGTYLYALARTESNTEWLDVYVSTDEGESWHRRGSAWVPEELNPDSNVVTGKPISSRGHGEPMVVERVDGSLWMLSRTHFRGLPIGESFSIDGGKSWTDVIPSHIKHTNSRFHIRRLNSGRLLLVKHSDEVVEDAGPWGSGGGRRDLTAYLSDDDGKTWPYRLLIEGGDCSYPDSAQSKDGRIFIAYDIGRSIGGIGAEIRMAIIREEDIKSGKLVSADSHRNILISRAGHAPDSSRDFSFAWTMPAQAQ